MKSPDEDSRNTEHDPSEVVRAANIFVDEVIAKAQEEALIKYQKKQVHPSFHGETTEFDPDPITELDVMDIFFLANTVVTDAVTNADEMKKLCQEEETESTFEEGKFRRPHDHHARLLQTDSFIEHDPENRSSRTVVTKSQSVERHHSFFSALDHLRPVDLPSHRNSLLSYSSELPAAYYSSTVFERAHSTFIPTRYLYLKILILLFSCFLMYVGIFFLYEMLKQFKDL